MSNSPDAKGLGVVDGELVPCPDSPNCVSTFDTTEVHSIDPVAYEGSREAAMSAILEYLNAPNSEKIQVVESTEEYVHAVFITPVMRFRDDVEFYLPEGTQTIHFRSASRLGYGDLGKNRERMEAFRAAFKEATAG